MLKPGFFDPKFDPTGSRSIYNAIQRFLRIIDRIWKARRKDILILQIHKPIAVNFFKVHSNTNMVKILIFHGSYKISHRNLIWFRSNFLIARFHINLRKNYSHKRNIIIPCRSRRRRRIPPFTGNRSKQIEQLYQISKPEINADLYENTRFWFPCPNECKAWQCLTITTNRTFLLLKKLMLPVGTDASRSIWGQLTLLFVKKI